MLSLGLALLLAGHAFASFCGPSMVPYSFEVLRDGQPVLGCGRPTCFGWSPNGKPYSQEATFYRIRGAADGFAREDREEIAPFQVNDPRYRIPQTANCEPGFSSPSCLGQNSWVGGIAPLLNVTEYATMLRCCTYEPLAASEDRGVASVSSGQIVVGGEVISGGQQYAFDYIADAYKYIKEDGSVQYDVSIRRFPCSPTPSVADVHKYQKPMDVRFAPNRAQAFQESILNVNQPIPPPGSHESHEFHGSHESGEIHDFTENGVIEEIVRQDAIQLPPGTELQPVQQAVAPQFVAPPAQAVPAAAATPSYYYYYPYYSTGTYEATLCFSGDMEVDMADGSKKRMDQLEKNDYVMSLTEAGVSPVPVSFWLHRVPSQQATFHQFELEDGKIIKLTSHHYIYKGDCSRVDQSINANNINMEAVFAQDIQETDCLYAQGEDNQLYERRIVRSTLVSETGIYAPMTSNGKIIVNGIYASCHNILHSHSLQNAFFSFIDAVTETYRSFFGHSDVTETPFGLNTLISTFDLVIPKNLASI